MLETTAIIALVYVLTWVAKKTKIVGKKNRFAPLLALILGIGLTFLSEKSISLELLYTGVMASFSTMGVYSGIKKTILGK